MGTLEGGNEGHQCTPIKTDCFRGPESSNKYAGSRIQPPLPGPLGVHLGNPVSLTTSQNEDNSLNQASHSNGQH